MTKLRLAVLITAGAVVLLLVGAGAVFYVTVYRPIGSPLMAISGGRVLEERRLQNREQFRPPASGELTSDQIARFVAVEEAVQQRIAAGAALLARKQAELEQAHESGALSIRTALSAFGEIRKLYLDAKVAQVDAMNQANFSKAELEWVRKQLYGAAGLRLAQLDFSEVLDGVPDASVLVRRFTPVEGASKASEERVRPLIPRLEAWLPLAFFGL